MKILVVSFANDVDISKFTPDVAVDITDGTNTVNGGSVMYNGSASDPVVPAHTHVAQTVIESSQ